MSYSEALVHLNSLQESFSFKNHFSKISYHHIFKKTLSLPSTGGDCPGGSAAVSPAPQAFFFFIVYKCEESSRPITVHSLGHPLSSSAHS